MSNQFPSNYNPSSGFDSRALLEDSVQSQSIYSKSYYPLKKLSRYSRSPQKSHLSSNNSYKNSKTSYRSKHDNKSFRNKTSQLEEAYYPESVRETDQSRHNRESYYTQESDIQSNQKTKSFKKKSKNWNKSQKNDSRYSKKTKSKRSPKESYVSNESDYERFLRERYPDMVSNQSQQKSTYNPSFQESQQVSINLIET